MDKLFLSPSQLGTFNTCRRKWAYSYVRKFKEHGKVAPDFGSALHKAVDVVFLMADDPSTWEQWDDPTEGVKFHARKAFEAAYADMQPDIPPDEWRTNELAGDIIDGYVDEHFNRITNLEVLEVEKSFKYESAPGVMSVGRVDKVVRDPSNGKTYIMDLKTTSAYSREHRVQPSWFEKFLLSEQVSAYLAWANDEYGVDNVGGFVVDCVLVHRNVRHYEHRVFRRTQGQLAAFREEFRSTAEDIKRSVAEGVFPKSLSACGLWGGCPYQPLCVQHDRFRDVPANPPEYMHNIKLVEGSTASRIAAKS